MKKPNEKWYQAKGTYTKEAIFYVRATSEIEAVQIIKDKTDWDDWEFKSISNCKPQIDILTTEVMNDSYEEA